MKKLTWILVAVFIIACVSLSCGMAPAFAETAPGVSEPCYTDANVAAASDNETIYFTSVDITNITTDGGAPIFYTNYGAAYSCGPVAGTEITVFYDKYFENLVPDWQSYYPASGKYRVTNSTLLEPIFWTLYNLMKCNMGAVGVSEADFKSGLQAYFKSQGYSLSYQTATKSGTLDWDTCVSAINNNKAIVLFVGPGKIYEINTTWDDRHILDSFDINSNHIMMAYGYVQIKYYNNGVNFRTEKFLTLATGYGIPTTAYLKINSDNLDAAYVMNVA